MSLKSWIAASLLTVSFGLIGGASAALLSVDTTQIPAYESVVAEMGPVETPKKVVAVPVVAPAEEMPAQTPELAAIQEIERLEGLIVKQHYLITSLTEDMRTLETLLDEEREKLAEIQNPNTYYSTRWTKAIEKGVISAPTKVPDHKAALYLAQQAYKVGNVTEAGTRLLQAMVICESNKGTVAANHVLDSFLGTIGTRNIHTMPVWFAATETDPGSEIIEDSKNPLGDPAVRDQVNENISQLNMYTDDGG